MKQSPPMLKMGRYHDTITPVKQNFPDFVEFPDLPIRQFLSEIGGAGMFLT